MYRHWIAIFDVEIPQLKYVRVTRNPDGRYNCAEIHAEPKILTAKLLSETASQSVNSAQ